MAEQGIGYAVEHFDKPMHCLRGWHMTGTTCTCVHMACGFYCCDPCSRVTVMYGPCRHYSCPLAKVIKSLLSLMLCEQDLRRSNFTSADCRKANFKGANLQGAYFSKFTCWRHCGLRCWLLLSPPYICSSGAFMSRFCRAHCGSSCGIVLVTHPSHQITGSRDSRKE